LPPSEARIRAELETATGAVVTSKLALVAPAGTLTLPGTAATDELLLRATVTPPAGAALESVTVPRDCEPAATAVGLSASARSIGIASAGGLMLRGALRFEPAKLALIVALASEETAEVETVKLALCAPAGTLTEAGTVAAEELLLSAIATPPAGAAAARVTVA